MGRLLVLAILVIAAVWLVKRALARPGRSDAPPPASRAGEGDLVPCAHCGVHLPRGEARAAGDAHYCSDEHAARGPRDGA